jgi:lysylphosphatidylglycerol synthetase-like protein (DUF2156 family)
MDERAMIEERAFLCGNAPESYDITSPSSSILRTPSGEGFLNVFADRRFWHIPGGLIVDDCEKPSTIEWLKQTAVKNKQTVAVYSVNAEEKPLFEQAGFVVNKFGEEPVIDLQRLDWCGKSFEWVRRQTNFCRRHGLIVTEVTSIAEQQSMAAELMEVLIEDLRDRFYSKPLKLLEGQFDPQFLARKRLFVAHHPASKRIEGFLAASPMENGMSWAFETYRKRPDSVRGTIPFLFREVIDRLQSEGVRRVSLCLVPGKGVETDRSASADRRVRWLLGLWYSRLNLVFNASGQGYFKSRFRPQYVDRYICVYPWNSWLSILSFLRTSGAHQINFGNCATKFARSLNPWRRPIK